MFSFTIVLQAKILEQEAHTALDKLTSDISTLNLERVRQIKSRLVAITGRVQKVECFWNSLPLPWSLKSYTTMMTCFQLDNLSFLCTLLVQVMWEYTSD